MKMIVGLYKSLMNHPNLNDSIVDRPSKDAPF